MTADTGIITTNSSSFIVNNVSFVTTTTNTYANTNPYIIYRTSEQPADIMGVDIAWPPITQEQPWPLVSQEPVKFHDQCKHCGTLLQLLSKFCNQCGKATIEDIFEYMEEKKGRAVRLDD